MINSGATPTPTAVVASVTPLGVSSRGARGLCSNVLAANYDAVRTFASRHSSSARGPSGIINRDARELASYKSAKICNAIIAAGALSRRREIARCERTYLCMCVFATYVNGTRIKRGREEDETRRKENAVERRLNRCVNFAFFQSAR